MVYLGSKKRLSKYIVPILQNAIDENTVAYIEPFVGGANIIDKVKCNIKIGSDIHEGLIELLNHVRDFPEDIPEDISEEEYNYVKNHKDEFPLWYVAMIGFNATFAGKYWGGYGRSFNGKGESRTKTMLRTLRKQSEALQGIEFICCDYIYYTRVHGCVIYCDIPYRDTTKYSTGKFDYDKFYEWCKEMSKENMVFISEYHMPEGFVPIWEKEVSVNVDVDNVSDRIEKLWVWRG